ncbi:MAG: UvrD-helicase domain-containing protein [Tannerella sp.]|jgi:ATP-dependent exoDNAse (exonuclease V) beta subunit|nr:UvrD-helicase domain-containing protein [Tannerella sp.]
MLTIYSASAGTGKTHTLTGEYLSLLLKGRDAHRRILAVTFTNKATAEMKKRIIEELFRLADNQPSDYISLLSEDGKWSEETIRSRAKNMLVTILHDYSALNISTIDHFFQRTVRAFAREIGLQGNYQIEISEERMKRESVENMLSGLEKEDNPDLLNWLLRFMEDKVDESGVWNVRQDIINLGGQLFKESFKTYGARILKDTGQKDFLSDYKNRLYGIVQSTRKRAREAGEAGVMLMKRHGVEPTELIYGNTSPFRTFERLAGGSMEQPSSRFYGLPDNVDGWIPKKAGSEQRSKAEALYSGGMNELLHGVVKFFDDLTGYHTADVILKNFHALGILTDLSQHLARWREENNKMPIADTTELLNRVIEGSEIPFIYEKTGTRIEHYMIDEFQDTSRMQWANFRPLLKDSLDSGRRNLIVGDVKQSIYRFRNSDWTLLDQQVKKDFAGRIDERNLDVNWRSYRNIVEFNNMIFRILPEDLQTCFNDEIRQSSLPEEEQEEYLTRIGSAYRQSRQHVAKPYKDKAGHVSVQFLSDTEEKKWEEQTLDILPQTIERLQENGYELRDIAILTRTSAEGMAAARKLLQYKEEHAGSKYKYDIISEESLVVSSSASVRWMVEMLKYLNQPDADSQYQMALMAYSVLKRKKKSGEKIDLFAAFPDEAVAKLKQLTNRSLYELTEGIFRLFESDFPESELVYIQSFLDSVAEFSLTETADMGKFLEQWEETGKDRKIVTPDTQNAIRIMTVHKSKGLGFKVVIMPYCDWELKPRDVIIWCHPQKPMFDSMALVPVKYSDTLPKTIFSKDYFHEKLHSYIDNLNTLYVGFTRAKEELIVTAPLKEPKSNSRMPKHVTIANLLYLGVSKDDEYATDPETGLYERGTWQHPADGKDGTDGKDGSNGGNGGGKDGNGSNGGSEQSEVEELAMKRFYSVSPDDRLHLRIHRKGGFIDDEKRKYGVLMHDILSRVVSFDDIVPAINEKIFLGEVSGDESEALREKLTELMRQEPVGSWFDGSMQVINEAEILFGRGRSRRPDRVMTDKNGRVVVADYKFGENKEESYRIQIGKYVSLIREMGYAEVTGYLWYITLNEIEKCIF